MELFFFEYFGAKLRFFWSVFVIFWRKSAAKRPTFFLEVFQYFFRLKSLNSLFFWVFRREAPFLKKVFSFFFGGRFFLDFFPKPKKKHWYQPISMGHPVFWRYLGLRSRYPPPPCYGAIWNKGEPKDMGWYSEAPGRPGWRDAAIRSRIGFLHNDLVQRIVQACILMFPIITSRF